MNKSTFKLLNAEQQFWYANIMIDMVLADGKIHPSEQKYLGMIFKFFADKPDKLAKLKQRTQTIGPRRLLPIDNISRELSLTILQDCVDEAISDAEFHEREQDLIREIGKLLKCNSDEVEELITKGKHLLGYIFGFAS